MVVSMMMLTLPPAKNAAQVPIVLTLMISKHVLCVRLDKQASKALLHAILVALENTVKRVVHIFVRIAQQVSFRIHVEEETAKDAKLESFPIKMEAPCVRILTGRLRPTANRGKSTWMIVAIIPIGTNGSASDAWVVLTVRR